MFWNNYASLCCSKIRIMKKLIRYICFVFALMITITVSAQEYIIKNEAGKLYLEHKVAAKEGLYGIGRNYNVHPADLAAYNSMDINKGLSLGQVLKVPLTENNFSQSTSTGTAVYYQVGVKEGLYRVGENANVPIENIKKWNKLTNENVSVGTKLIVGYMISGDPTQAVAKAEEKPVVPIVPVVIVKEEKKVEPKVEPKKEIVKPEVVKVKEEVKQEAKAEYVKQELIKTITNKISGNGYFKNEFESQIKEQSQNKELTVTSSIFKTVSGWQDGKYCFPAGHGEEGETMAQGCAREAFEEVGIKIDPKDLKFLHVQYRWSAGDDSHARVGFYFAPIVDPGEPKNMEPEGSAR